MIDKNFVYEELLKRGYSKQQAEAKVISGVIDILCDAGDKYDVVRKLEAEIECLEYKKEELEKWHQFYQKKQADEARKRQHEMDSTNNYIDQFYAALSECETKEARDRLKLAQIFRNSIDINTVYDNTAYINGMASILTGGEIAPINGGIKKVEKKKELGRVL